jgi:hypothetical protein
MVNLRHVRGNSMLAAGLMPAAGMSSAAVHDPAARGGQVINLERDVAPGSGMACRSWPAR